ARVGQVLEHVRTLEKELAALKGRLASSQGDDLAQRAVDVKGLKVLAAQLDGADAKTLRDTLDKLKDKLKSAVIVLAAVDGAKVQIAGELIDAVQGREFLLIERVAETLAEVALRNKLIDHVTISVKKRPPVQGLEWAGVEITRGRGDAGSATA